MHILVGDIGGTKTALAVYEGTPNGGYQLLARNVYPSAEHASLSAVLRRFLPTLDSEIAVVAAAFCVAGPVKDGLCSTTNLPWVISADELSATFGFPVALLNDFQAVALGVLELPESSLRVLQRGSREAHGVFAVIGAGTGLGEAVGLSLPPSAGGVRILASEGGHADFAPRDDVEWRLLQFFRQVKGKKRVSVERVVSGTGLGALYDFVVSDGLAPDDAETRRRFEHEQPGPVISERAAEDPAAARVLELFVSAYGAEAGNLALKVIPTAGLYVAGGVAARLVEQLDWQLFLTSFLNKGRLSELLQSIPVMVVRDLDVGLLGARSFAASLFRAPGTSQDS